MNKLFNKIAALSVGLAMAIGVGVAVSAPVKASRAHALTASDISNTPATTIENGAKYVIASGTSGNVYLAAKASSDWGTAVSVGSAYVFTAEGSGTSNFALKCADGYLKPKTGNSNSFLAYNSSTQALQLNNNKELCSNAQINYNLRQNGTSGFRWYGTTSAAGTTGTAAKLYKVTESNPVTSISIKTAPSKTSYFEGDKFDPTGLVISVNYQTGDPADITYAGHETDFSFTPSLTTNLQTTDTQVKVTYGGKYAYQAITVAQDTLSSITISGNMSQLTYRVDKQWDATGLVVTGTYVSGNKDVTDQAEFTFSPASPEAMGVGEDQTLSITATVAGVSNETPYEQTVTVIEVPPQVEITYSSYSDNLPASGYSEVAWSADGIGGMVKSIKNNNGQMQFQANSSYIYNNIAISGYIKSITITKANGSYTELTAYVADADAGVISSEPAEGGVTNDTDWTWNFDATKHYCYFRIDATSSSAKYFSKIVIDYEKVSLVDPTGIAIDDKTPISLDTYGYGARSLSAAVEPFNANDKSVTWASGDESIVTIADGVLTPVAPGQTHVYARTANYVSDVDTPDLFDEVEVTVTAATYRKGTYSPTSASTIDQSLDYLAGSSATVSSSGTYDNSKHAIQIAANKSATITISGYTGAKVVGIELVMSSNADAGAGGLVVTAGTTTIYEITTCAFDNAKWNGKFDANPVQLYFDVTDYLVGTNEKVVFAINGTVNSLYVHSVSLRYTVNTLSEWCQDFVDNYACNAAGTSAPSTSSWTEFANKFSVLSASEKADALAAEANEEGTLLEQAMAKYDYIVGKYNKGQGLTAYNDYINRNPLPIGGISLRGSVFFNETNTIVAVIIIASMVAIAGIGSYLLIRRRKEN